MGGLPSGGPLDPRQHPEVATASALAKLAGVVQRIETAIVHLTHESITGEEIPAGMTAKPEPDHWQAFFATLTNNGMRVADAMEHEVALLAGQLIGNQNEKENPMHDQDENTQETTEAAQEGEQVGTEATSADIQEAGEASLTNPVTTETSEVNVQGAGGTDVQVNGETVSASGAVEADGDDAGDEEE